MFIRSPALKQFSALRNSVFCLLNYLIHILGDKAHYRGSPVSGPLDPGIYFMEPLEEISINCFWLMAYCLPLTGQRTGSRNLGSKSFRTGDDGFANGFGHPFQHARENPLMEWIEAIPINDAEKTPG
jgi:hypothetical protein